MNAYTLEVRLLAALSMVACAVGTEPDAGLPIEGGPEVPTANPDALARGTLMVERNPQLWGRVAVELRDLPDGEVLLFAGRSLGQSEMAGVQVDLAFPTIVANRNARFVDGPHSQPAAVGDTLWLQAVSGDGRWRTDPVPSTVEMFDNVCGDGIMANTFWDAGWDESLRVIACDLDMAPGLCEPAAIVNGTAALQEAANIGPDAYTVGAGCLEIHATSACCYSFPVVQQPDTRGGGGGGGGAGGGGSWDGRPFRVHGEVRHTAWQAQAPVVHTLSCPPDLQDAVVDAWLTAAMQEHSSVAAFARFTLELMQLGAPLDLVHGASRAQLDEVRHTELALDLASRLGGSGFAATPVSMDGALDGRDLRTVTLDVVREGCLNETVSALIAMEARDAAEHPDVVAALTTIADDETRHAELAWRFVKWALAQDPTLRSDVMAELEAFDPGAPVGEDPQADALAAFGVLSPCRRQQAARRAGQVIARCSASLG